jgi:hypothetical protein
MHKFQYKFGELNSHQTSSLTKILINILRTNYGKEILKVVSEIVGFIEKGLFISIKMTLEVFR